MIPFILTAFTLLIAVFFMIAKWSDASISSHVTSIDPELVSRKLLFNTYRLSASVITRELDEASWERYDVENLTVMVQRDPTTGAIGVLIRLDPYHVRVRYASECPSLDHSGHPLPRIDELEISDVSRIHFPGIQDLVREMTGDGLFARYRFRDNTECIEAPHSTTAKQKNDALRLFLVVKDFAGQLLESHR